jgi:hypothetical protein
MDIARLEKAGLYVESHASSKATKTTVMFCKECQKELMTLQPGEMLFHQEHGDCTCSWGCHGQVTNKRHPRHLAYKEA